LDEWGRIAVAAIAIVAWQDRLSILEPARFLFGGGCERRRAWALAIIVPTVIEFNKSIVDYPSIKREPGGASTDWRPDLQRPDNPVPLLDMKNPPRVKAGGG